MKNRKQTGICETCHVDMSNHPKCEACWALCGIPHPNVLCSYRGYQLCFSCIHAWEKREEILGRKVTWDEFTNPKPKLQAEMLSVL